MKKFLIEMCLVVGVIAIATGEHYGTLFGRIVEFIGGVLLTFYTFHTHDECTTPKQNEENLPA